MGGIPPTAQIARQLAAQGGNSTEIKTEITVSGLLIGEITTSDLLWVK